MSDTPEPMTESEYITVLNSYEADARTANTKYVKDSAELLRRYKGEPYGNERDERSKVISNDVMDVVESDMPALTRIFLSLNKIVTFTAGPGGADDLEEANQKTEYIDWIVRRQKDSFRTQFSFLKDVISQKMGALKWFMEDVKETKEETFEDLSAEELQIFMASLEGDDVQKVEIVERGETVMRNDGPFKIETFNGKIKVTVKTRKAKVISVPLESLLFSSNAQSEDTADLVGDRIDRTRGELLKEGYKAEVINKLRISPNQENTQLPQIRLNDQGGVDSSDNDGFRVWANQKVEICDLYVMIDKDGDGIAERRHVLKSGDVILEDEAFPQVPYAICSAILMQHAITGISRAELAAPTAEIQTAIKRGVLDNIYAVNAPQIGVNDLVDHDDLLTKRPGGIVRVDGKESPSNSIFPFNVPYIGDKALQVIQHFDQERAQTTGVLATSQGLSSDTFEKETATRFKGVEEANQAKIELVVRVISEIAYKRMYDGIADMVSQYQTTEQEIMVLGEPLRVNPAKWRFNHSVNSSVGLGAGDATSKVQTLTGILTIQTQLLERGSPLVDEVKIYNTVDAIMKASDIHDTAPFFNNPERPNELVQAENEKLKGVLQQMQQAIEQQQNPFTEAEMIKAQSKQQTDQVKAQTDMTKTKADVALKIENLKEEARQFDISTAQDEKQSQEKLALELTKIEATTGKDVPGSVI